MYVLKVGQNYTAVYFRHCFPKDTDEGFYSCLLPQQLFFAFGVTCLLLVIFKLIKVRVTQNYIRDVMFVCDYIKLKPGANQETSIVSHKSFVMFTLANLGNIFVRSFGFHETYTILFMLERILKHCLHMTNQENDLSYAGNMRGNLENILETKLLLPKCF